MKTVRHIDPQQTSLLDPTRNYHQGHENSVAAHDSIKPSKDALRLRIVNYIISRGLYGATSDEVEQGLGLTHQTASARLTEAKAKGELIVSGMKRKTRSGRKADVLIWRG